MEIVEGVPVLLEISKFINSEDFEFFGKNKEDIKESCELMSKHVKLMVENLQITEVDISLPKKCLHIFGNTILEDGLPDYISMFITKMLELISNWNNNLACNNDIALLCKLLFFLLEINKNLSKAINVLRISTERNKMLNEWHPPAFEVSKEYLNVLLEKAEKLDNSFSE
jgi:hypothetical protein